MIVNFANFETNDDATANAFNSRFGAILDAINGNLDATNLANGAVTTPKLADGAVTNSKLQTLQAVRCYLATNNVVLSGPLWHDFPADTTAYTQGFTVSGGAKVTPTTPGFFNVRATITINDVAAIVAIAAIVVNNSDNSYTNESVMFSSGNVTIPMGIAPFSMAGTLKVGANQSILFRFFNDRNTRLSGLAQASGDNIGSTTQFQVTEIR